MTQLKFTHTVKDWISLKLIKISHLRKNVILLSASSFFSQALSILLTPIICRIYTPEDFGIFNFFLSILAPLCVFASFRYELAIPVAKKTEELNLILIAFLSVTILSLLTTIGLWLGHSMLFSFQNMNLLEPFWGFLPLGLFLSGSFNIFTYWLIRNKFFKVMAFLGLFQAIFCFISQLGFGLLRIGSHGLFWSSILTYLAANSILFFFLYKHFDFAPPGRINFYSLKQTAHQYRKFPLTLGPSALINTLGLQLPLFLFTIFCGPQATGWLVFGQTVGRIPLVIIGEPISRVFFSETAQGMTHSDDLRKIYLRSIRYLCLIGGAYTAIMYFVAPSLFAVFFGENLREGGVYLQFLFLMILAELIVSPLSQILIVLKKMHWQLYWDIGRLLFILSALVLAHLAGWARTPRTMVLTYSASFFLTYIVLLFMHLLAIHEKEREVAHE